MNSTKSHRPRFRSGDWVAFQFGPSRVSAKVLEDRGRLGVRGQRLYRVQVDENSGEAAAFEMPENELEAVAPPIRQAFSVRYIRQGNTNTWLTDTVIGRVLKGVKAKGAVSYTTGQWEGETALNVRHATVEVLLEIEPPDSEASSAANSTVDQSAVASARQLADELFRSRHPRARIQHEQSPG